jgi:hypothetical protein
VSSRYTELFAIFGTPWRFLYTAWDAFSQQSATKVFGADGGVNRDGWKGKGIIAKYQKTPTKSKLMSESETDAHDQWNLETELGMLEAPTKSAEPLHVNSR